MIQSISPKQNEWSVKKIGELGEFYGGSTPSTVESSYWDGDICFLVPSDISNLDEHKIYISGTESKITQVGLKSCSTVLLQPGTVCVSSRATIGDCVITEIEICTNQGFINIVCNHLLLNQYLVYWIRQNKNQLLKYSAGTTFGEIGRRSFQNIKIKLPPLPEQWAIASVLSKVDDAIAAVKKSIKKAERLKKALMQNLLTGKLKPDGTRRTDDEFYTDEKFGKVPVGWEVCSVTDVFEINNNTLSSNTGSNFHFNYITIESVSTENINLELVDKHLFKDSPSRARRVLSDGDLVISTVRPNLKAFFVFEKPNDENWVCSTGFNVLTAKENQNNKFYFYQILSEIGEKQFFSFISGTNYPAVTERDFKRITFYKPPIEVQNEVSEKISKFSIFIRSKEIKIQKLERLKKALMQNLLTGKKRLKADYIQGFADG